MLTTLKPSLLLLFIAAAFPLAHSKDDTIADGLRGKDVTEAVLRKISKSGIFPDDNSFLIRLAYVESRFGESNTTFRLDYYGGIWQVEESVFRITQTNHSSLFPLHTAIQSQFQIDWKRITWKELLRPLYSGLAAALYFARVSVIEPIPQTILTQADHWRKYYRPLGNVAKFIEDAEDLRNQTRCRGKMDLCIVLDGSGSINQVDRNNYQRAKNFTASMIESFTLDFTRIGMLIFSDDPELVFNFRNNQTINQLATLARNARYPDSGTRTDKAIKLAVAMFKNLSSTVDEGVPKIMTVFTDGQSDRGSDIIGAVDLIRNNSIKSVSVGIGHSLNMAELTQIALNDIQSVFTLNDFLGLQDFLQKITSVACEIPQKPVLNTTYDDSLIQNEKRIYKIESPPEGITVTLLVKIGKTNGYWSHTEEVPNSAIHDGVIDGPTFIPAPAKSRQADNEASIYFTIQGIETTNNYTLSMNKGNQAGGGGGDGGGNGNGAPSSITIFGNLIAIVLIVLHAVVN